MSSGPLRDAEKAFRSTKVEITNELWPTMQNYPLLDLQK